MLEIWYNENSARVGVRSARARAAGTRYPKGTGTGALVPGTLFLRYPWRRQSDFVGGAIVSETDFTFCVCDFVVLNTFII